MSLMEAERMLTEQEAAEKLLSVSAVTFDRIGGGANSRVYHFVGSDTCQYAVKFYFMQESDTRDRLGTEFASMSFLWEQGLRCVPRPIMVDRKQSCAVYEYVEGSKISFQDVTAADIDEVIVFLEQLKCLNDKASTKSFGSASEACFSTQQIFDNIQWRIKRLEHSLDKNKDLNHFLVNDYIPFLEILIQREKEKLVCFDSEIPLQERTLSPSDYGFHNAIRNKEGKIIFFDFEYFGWDDPAKMISDFILHPAMDLSNDLKNRFIQKMYAVFQDYSNLPKRVETAYALFGLKWCLIFLNEFVEDDLQRRKFAQGDLASKKQRQEEQLFKAKQMLNLIKETYQEFPYKYEIR